MNVHGYALELEMTFRAFSQSINVSADALISNFNETLESCLGYLSAMGYLKKDEMVTLIEEYTFHNERLADILADDSNIEKIEELMTQLKELKKGV